MKPQSARRWAISCGQPASSGVVEARAVSSQARVRVSECDVLMGGRPDLESAYMIADVAGRDGPDQGMSGLRSWPMGVLSGRPVSGLRKSGLRTSESMGMWA